MASPLTAPKSDAAIVVVGLDGAATSAAARALATAQRRVAIDAGALVEQRFAHAAADAPAAGHEAAFRALEERVVCELLDNAATDDVISLGGDAVASERSAATSSSGSTSIQLSRGGDVGPASERRRASARHSRRSTPRAGRSTRRSPTRSCRPAQAEASPAPTTRSRACAMHLPGRACCGL